MKIDLKAKLKLWFLLHKRDVFVMGVVVAGCALFGALVLDPPRKVGYQTATVTQFGIRHGSKKPGVEIWLDMGKDGHIAIRSRAYNPALRVGAKICVLKTKGSVSGRLMYQQALPSRCLKERVARKAMQR